MLGTVYFMESGSSCWGTTLCWSPPVARLKPESTGIYINLFQLQHGTHNKWMRWNKQKSITFEFIGTWNVNRSLCRAEELFKFFASSRRCRAATWNVFNCQKTTFGIILNFVISILLLLKGLSLLHSSLLHSIVDLFPGHWHPFAAKFPPAWERWLQFVEEQPQEVEMRTKTPNGHQ